MGTFLKSRWSFAPTFVLVSCLALAVMAQTDGSAPPSDPIQNSTIEKPTGQDSKKQLATQPLTSGGWAVVIVSIVLLAVTGTFLVHAARFPESDYIFQLKPLFFFWLGMFYLVALLTVAVLKVTGVFVFIPQGDLIANILPIGIPWFGALGAVTISLQGVFVFNGRWNSNFNYWHIGRPILGAVLGVVAFFMFVLVVKASGATVDFQKSEDNRIIYYVLAFIVGYREATFRELLQRVTDLILKPDSAVPPTPPPTPPNGADPDPEQ